MIKHRFSKRCEQGFSNYLNDCGWEDEVDIKSNMIPSSWRINKVFTKVSKVMNFLNMIKRFKIFFFLLKKYLLARCGLLFPCCVLSGQSVSALWKTRLTLPASILYLCMWFHPPVVPPPPLWNSGSVAIIHFETLHHVCLFLYWKEGRGTREGASSLVY